METATITSRSNGSPLTLGVFIGLYGDYQEAVWDGIAQVAEEYNANILCFVGAALEDGIAFRKHWNAIYSLAGPANIDGLIIFSSAMQNFVTVERFTQFCADYAPLPTISVAQKLKDIPSVTIDNSVGLCELIEHLILCHHYKHIAFIRGPEGNPEADTRYQAYVKTLETHGIRLDTNLVVPGSFLVEAGIEAVKLLLDHRSVSFEAIVAANDDMAIGAWQELNRRGFNVPEDVALVGFDDISEAEIFAVPLTTVRQSLTEQGRQAAQMLLEWLQRGRLPGDSVVETELMIRESCGCLPSSPSRLAASAPVIPTSVSEDAFAKQRNVVLVNIQEAICPYFASVSPESIEPLVDVFFDVLQGKTSSQFLPLFGRLLRQCAMALTRAGLEEGLIFKWQEVLSILRETALSYRSPSVTEDVEGLLYQGFTLIVEATRRAHLSLENRAEASMLAQSEIVRDINATSNIQQITDFLSQNLSKLGINTCILALYEGESAPSPQSRLLMAYHKGQGITLESGGRLFPSAQLIPPDILSRAQWPYLSIHPLVSRDTHFGFIMMEMVAGQRSMYNTYIALAEQIGSALYKALLQQQNERARKQLEQHAVRLVQANIQLAEANAELEQFAYVASHDLQEPLRMVTSYLQLLKKRYQDRLDDDAHEFIAYAVDGTTRMRRLIDDLLAYSRVSTRDRLFEPIDCEELLAQALSNLAIAIKDSDALITHSSLPSVMADSTQLVRVFQNLIGNAIKFRADRRPQIHISAEQQGGEWIFSVKDNGIGIPSEYLKRIFIIFSRLHTQAEYPGTGIGLAICRKVVERHGGRIWVDSQPGEGATFFFTIPGHLS